MFFKKIIFLIIIFFTFNISLIASEKDLIITQLNNLKSLEFTFNQTINDKKEIGNCLLQFPGKLKCNYYNLIKSFNLSNPLIELID